VNRLSPPAAKISDSFRARLGALGLALRFARTQRKLTRDELAAKLLLSRNTLQRIESGDPAVSMGYYAATAEYLGVPLLAEFQPGPLSKVPGFAHGRAGRKKRDWF
jgi:transcriptional regulator with XRE-family HTH domain